jgi:hypothetical protein
MFHFQSRFGHWLHDSQTVTINAAASTTWV